jgi:putative addiction module component (TIGR02574 family)
MNGDPHTLFETALALPEDQRMALAQLLLESLPDDVEDAQPEDLLSELDRRRAEVERGTAEAIPWSQLRDEE